MMMDHRHEPLRDSVFWRHNEESVHQCGQHIFELMLKTASGQPTKSESLISTALNSRLGCAARQCRGELSVPRPPARHGARLGYLRSARCPLFVLDVIRNRCSA